MTTDQISTRLVVVVVSELIALFLIWRLCRSNDHMFFKITLSLIALVPIFGPLIALWVGNFPDVAPRILQDRMRYGSDVFDRWRYVLAEKDPDKRLKKWRELFENHRNEDP